MKGEAVGGRTYASGMAYGAHGGLSAVTLGNGTTESYVYDERRLQVSEVKLSKGAEVLERLVYKYGQVDASTGSVDARKNNGQVGEVENSIGGELQWQQRMTYDALGRLNQVSEHAGNNLSGTTYKTVYEYDRYGNRKMSANQAQALPYTPVLDTEIDAQSNRFTNNVTYDDAGNVVDDNKFTVMRYAYDANGRQKGVLTRGGAEVSSSVYDGLGQRVQTTSGSETRSYVYDTFGRVVAEYSNQEQTGAGGLKYVSVDGQGSTRVITDASGNAVVRRDYEPFGVEVGAGVGLRTASQKYGESEGTRQRYAWMERDANLDHTPWREYDKRGGRWTTPDPYTGSMSVGDPQSLNRYAYVGNDPVNFVDPLGLDEKPFVDGGVVTVIGRDPWEDLPNMNAGTLATELFFLPLAPQNTQDHTFPGRGNPEKDKGTTCPAVPFKVTGIAPGQAPDRTAISQTPRADIPNGGVAIKPGNFGVSGINGNNRSVFLSMRFTVDWNSSPAGIPSGIPTRGLFFPVDNIGPRSVRLSPGNMIDVYNYSSSNEALNSTRTVMVTTYIPANTVGVICPKGN